MATRAAVAVVAAAVALLALAGPAAAHATVTASIPADGTAVETAPARVEVRFSEPVTFELGGLTVLDGDGARVDDGPTTSDAAGTTLSVGLRPDLPDGTYVTTYRVLSADGHPVSGSLLWGVGDAPVAAGAPGAGGGTSSGWEAAGAVARFATYLGGLLAAGLALFLGFVHDGAPDARPLRRLVRIATLVAAAGLVATVATQAALLTGRGLDAAVDVDVLRSVLDDRLGWSALVLLAGLAAVHLSTAVARPGVAQALAFYGGLAVCTSSVLWGHATQAPHRWLVLGADAVHVIAAAVWLGGLVGLAVVLRRRDPALATSTAEVVGRFSAAAAASAVALVAAGVAMAWVESDGSLDALTTTTYGRLVLAKSAIVLPVLGLAAYNRWALVPAVRRAPAEEPGPTRAVRRLRAAVGTEAVALVAALAVTAVLVNVTPARDAVTTDAPAFSAEADTDTGTVELVVSPARAGRTTIDVRYLDADGEPDDVADTLTVELSLPAAELGPLRREVEAVGPGHFVLEGDEVSVPGLWTITLAARTSDFTEERTTFDVPVEG